MKTKVLSIISSLSILALTLNFTPVLAEDETIVNPGTRNIQLSEGEQPIQHPKLPKIDYPDYGFSEMLPGHLGLTEELLPDREYIPPSPEDLAETARMVQSFDCSTVIDVPQIECEALVALYNSTNGAGWTNNTNWLETNKVGD